ncbi:TonB-dependent receptor [Thalassotalea ganghwensis]
MLKRSTLAIAITASLATFALQANEQSSSSALETIEVTSNFKKQSLASTPLSIDVISQQQLQDQSMQHFDNVLSSLANVNFAGGTSRPKYLQIRGVGERSEYLGAPNASVGFIIDDIDLSGLGMAANMYDVAQVEVLRGPQGTRFGANALAGLVYIQSNPADGISEHGVSTSFGNDDLVTIAGYSAGALTNDVNYRVSLENHQQNGFSDNQFLNRDDTNQLDELSGKIKLSAQLSQELTFDTTMIFADMDNGFDAWTLDNNGFITLTDKPGVDNQKSVGASFKFHYTGLTNVDLTAITSISTTDHQHAYDGDWANADYWSAKQCPDSDDENGNGAYDDTIPCVYDYTWSKTAERDVISQEFRFSNKDGQRIFNQTTDWLFGVYASQLEESNITDDYYNGWSDDALLADYEADNLAIFTQLDSELNDTYQLSVGLRIEQRDAQYQDSSNEAFSPEETMWGGHIALSRALTADSQGYIRIAKGYKAGGFNMGLSDKLAQFKEFDTETLFNYELGINSSFNNGKVNTRFALFYMDRQDQQVNASQQDSIEKQKFTIYTANAASSTSHGLEAALDWQVTSAWSAYANLGYLDASYDDYRYFDEYGSLIDISGRELAHAAKFTYSLGTTYQHTDGIFFNAYVTGKSGFYFSDSHSEKADSSSTVNTRVGYEKDNWAIYLWARNLTDEKIATRGFYFGNEPDQGWAAKKYQRYAAPRQWGLTLDYRF